MSFASPLWLLVLALIPAALAAQRLTRARARRYAVRFPAVKTLQQAITGQPSWTRHVPAATLLLGLAAIALALARPHQRYRAPVGQASLVLVTDHSGSMAANDVQPTRLAAAVNAADSFIGQLPSTVRLGAVTFSTVPDAVQGPVTDHAAARSIIGAQNADGGTNTGGALTLALQLLAGSSRHHPPSAIVLLSDGAANLGPDPVTVAAQARRDRIPIYTVALGTAAGTLSSGPLTPPVPVPPDPELMRRIARTSGARAFSAQTADQLSSIYRSLASRLGTVKRSRDITADFAIAAAVLLFGGATLSIRSSGRLP